jgi:hypothetical protein
VADIAATKSHDRRSGRLRRSDDCNIDLAIKANEVAIEVWARASVSQACRAGVGSSSVENRA